MKPPKEIAEIIRTRKFFRLLLPLFFALVNINISFAQPLSDSTYWWNDAVFYQVFVRSFKDSDGDGKGDLKGLIQKLDYLNDGDSSTHHDLGVSAIWLMPVQQSPSYHGYDVTDYRTIEQDYGSNLDFQNFIDSAHARGIKVIIDLVMNHTSSQHPWFVESLDPLSEKRSWYTWQNTNPGNTGPWGQTVWHSKNGSYHYGIFWSEMPDLNYNTQQVKDEMFDVARFWLEDMNADGFRLDAIRYIFENGTTLEDTPETIDFWKDFKSYYKSVDEDAMAVGEAWTSTEKIADYMSDTTLDFCFEFDLANAIINAANTGTVAALQSQVDEVIATYPFLQYGTFLTNHDMNRVMNQLGMNDAKAKLAADLLLTLPGVPYIYYGEEIGMTGSGVDENKRTPLQWNSSAKAGFTTGTPWRAVNSDYTTKNIESQQRDVSSLWSHYRNLISIRNGQAALRRGNYKTVSASSSSVFAFLRQYDDENILVLSNAGTSPVSNVLLNFTQGGIAAGNYILVELQGGDQLPVVIDNVGNFSNLSVSQIPAKTTLIYKLLAPSDIIAAVTFRVDMNAMIASGNFLPATESVDITADFNSFGADSIVTLSDIDGDGIYTITVSGLSIGSKLNYKYRINAMNDGREELSLREYFIPEGLSALADIYEKQNLAGLDPSSKYAVNVYPVPSNKEIFIEFAGSFTGTIYYKVSDLLGEEKASFSFAAAHAGLHSFSCEGLLPGVYQLLIECQETSRIFRIVIQK
ncbi:MAG: hypothetical protein K2X86_07025 [Cytophagaceae bacterium]|nr:hypothetical protein [Cytophagaceae bacterium]